MAPGVVVVSGLPAAGKSTLSRKIADALGLVHVCKDDMKRPLGPIILTARPDQVPQAMSALCTQVMGSVLDAGHGCVIDANFNMPIQGAPIREFIRDRRVDAFEVCLWADPEVLRQRFIARADPPLTPDLQEYFERALHRERTPVLGPPTPTVEFDTTEFAAMTDGLPGLLKQIELAL